jgi:protein-S-isoprenylcysteine O-methyltransferase Ste14
MPTLWLAWLAYWTAAAFFAKPTRRKESVASRASHLLPLYVGVALLVAPHLADPWLAMRFLPRSVTWFWLGLLLVALGLGFAVAARGWLGGNWSSAVTLKLGHEFIRCGPYRFVRHPIYTGLLLALLGTAIAIGEWRGLIALVLITVAFLRKLTIEERLMTEQFGEAYARYRDEVPALLPIWR